MAGCSKKQYAIMMSSGSEGQKLASKMGSMEQEEFNKAFAELLQSDSAADASYKAEHSKWSKEEDEDYQDFDVTSEEDYGFDDEEDENDESSQDKEKPLHIKSLENQVSRNPDYKAIADSLTDNKELNDKYFYAFKDAYERNGYNPSDEQIKSELEDAYWRMQDDFRDRRGLSEAQFDRYGIDEFENNYGTLEDFVNKGIEAHNKYFDDLGPAGGSGELSNDQGEDTKIVSIAGQPVDENNGFKVYEDKIRDDISKIKTKEDAEYVADLIDNNLEAGYISEELSDELYNELDKMIDENVAGMPLYNVGNKNKNSEGEGSQPYQSKYKSEDYEDARFYPVSDEDRKAAGPRYLGRYHSIFDAAGLDDNEPGSWKKANEMFKYVGDSDTGASIVQGPDGYFSGNPRINSMSFKTFEQAKDYLDRKNPEEHKYGVYFKPGDEREYVYRDAEDKYDLEAPDAYRNAREAEKSDRIGNRKGKVGDRELSLNELIEKTNKLDDRELARDIIAIQAPKFNLSEKEILDYYDKVGKK